VQPENVRTIFSLPGTGAETTSCLFSSCHCQMESVCGTSEKQAERGEKQDHPPKEKEETSKPALRVMMNCPSEVMSIAATPPG
jgi:hypothetical protein